MKTRCLWPVVVLVVLLAGCTGSRLCNPGPERYQQAQAQHFDPYPENDMGPAVVGGRPGEYRAPPPEVLRVQPRLGATLPYPGQPPAYVPPPGYAQPPAYVPPGVVQAPQAPAYSAPRGDMPPAQLGR
jgi:hypothetical protein